MADERGSFRRRIFGGFDRNDVIKYIETIAVQRNNYQSETQKLRQEADELRSRLDGLTDQLDSRDVQLANTAGELEAARKELDDVWKELREALDELEVVKGQLECTSRELTSKTAQYEQEISVAQAALDTARRNGEKQRTEAVNSASAILTVLQSKFEDARCGADLAADSVRKELDTVSGNMSAMSAAFTDAEAELEKLLTNKEN